MYSKNHSIQRTEPSLVAGIRRYPAYIKGGLQYACSSFQF